MTRELTRCKTDGGGIAVEFKGEKDYIRIEQGDDAIHVPIKQFHDFMLCMNTVHDVAIDGGAQ